MVFCGIFASSEELIDRTPQPVDRLLSDLIFAYFVVTVDRILKPVDRFMTEPQFSSVPSTPTVADVPRRRAAVSRHRRLTPPHNPLTEFGLYETPNMVNGLGPNLKARSKIVLD